MRLPLLLLISVCWFFSGFCLGKATAITPFDGNAAKAWEISTQYWGRTPNCKDFTKAGYASYEEMHNKGRDGEAQLNSCEIRIYENYQPHSFYGLCEIMVHEMGHMLGYGHIPGTIMDGETRQFAAMCAPEQLNRTKEIEYHQTNAARWLKSARIHFWRAKRGHKWGKVAFRRAQIEQFKIQQRYFMGLNTLNLHGTEETL